MSKDVFGKGIVLGIIILFVGAGVVPNIVGEETYFGDTITVPDDYPTIQEAVDAANSDDTVFVRNGTYFENVVVNKSIELIGEQMETTVIDGNGTGSVIKVIVNRVNINGFTIQNGGDCQGSDDRDAGIDVKSNHTIVCNIIILDNAAGIIISVIINRFTIINMVYLYNGSIRKFLFYRNLI